MRGSVGATLPTRPEQRLRALGDHLLADRVGPANALVVDDQFCLLSRLIGGRAMMARTMGRVE